MRAAFQNDLNAALTPPGKVYDVTADYPCERPPWLDHRAGQDPTGCLKEAIHGGRRATNYA